MSARNDVINLIKNNSNVQSLLGVNLAATKQKVFPIIIPQLEELPRISVKQINETPEECKIGLPKERFIDIQVNIYHTSVDRLDALDNVVEMAVHRQESGNTSNIRLIGRSEDYLRSENFGGYVKSQTYRVLYENPAT